MDPTSINIVDLSFMAIDSNHATSSKLHVTVIMCSGCGGKSNGECNFNSYTPIDDGMDYRLADCKCNVGWTGEDCEIDIDGCLESECIKDSCQDVSPSEQQTTGLSYKCNVCNPGYQPDNNKQCIDVDECVSTSVCAQLCVNTLGGFRCECGSGYRAKGTLCNEINECDEGTHNCTEIGQICQNTLGSYECQCRDGFSLKNGTCMPNSICTTNLGCEYGCMVWNNLSTCVCPSGLALGSDGKSCKEIDECNSLDTNRCSSPELCQDLERGYTCGCPAGSMIGSDMRICQACTAGYWGKNCANKCDCGPNVKSCDPVSGCSTCITGWTSPPLCNKDVDECTTGAAVCDPQSTCHNVDGAYTCICNAGFQKKLQKSVC